MKAHCSAKKRKARCGAQPSEVQVLRLSGEEGGLEMSPGAVVRRRTALAAETHPGCVQAASGRTQSRTSHVGIAAENSSDRRRRNGRRHVNVSEMKPALTRRNGEAIVVSVPHNGARSAVGRDSGGEVGGRCSSACRRYNVLPGVCRYQRRSGRNGNRTATLRTA